MRCNPAPAPPSKAVFPQSIPCGFRVLFEQIRPWGPKTEEKKIKETKCLQGSCSNSSPLLLFLCWCPRWDQALQEKQAQSPHHLCTYSQTRACRREKGKDFVKEIFICKPNKHLVCTSGTEISVSLLHKRGCSPSVPQDYCHPKNNPLPSTTTWFSPLPCVTLKPQRRLFGCINCRQKTRTPPH